VSAAIILHGMFLLVCHNTAEKTCDIVAPHTTMDGQEADAHEYMYASGLTHAQKFLPAADYQNRLSLGVGELAPGTSFPFDQGYAQNHFLLDGSKVKVTYGQGRERTVITVPWPDNIVPGNQVAVQALLISSIPNDPDIATQPTAQHQYIFGESAALIYSGASTFRLKQGSTVLDTFSGVLGGRAIVVISSWPASPSNMGDHTWDLNHLLSDVSQHVLNLSLTGIMSSSVFCQPDLNTGFDGLKLPSWATTMPNMCKKGESHQATGTETGCPFVSLEDDTQRGDASTSTRRKKE